MSSESAAPSAFFRLSLVLYSVMFIIGAGLAAWQGHLRGWVQVSTLPADAAIGIGAGLTVVLLSRPWVAIPAARRVALEMGEVVQGLALWQMALMALFSGVGEEAFFRGALAPRWSVWLVVSTLVFAVVHIGRAWRFLWWTGFALVVGALLATLYVWRGNLVAPALAHVTVNLLNLPFLSRLYREAKSNGLEA